MTDYLDPGDNRLGSNRSNTTYIDEVVREKEGGGQEVLPTRDFTIYI